MATTTHPNTSTKVIRIQDDEKELLFRLREIYGNDYKKYGEYIRRESNVPLTIKKIYKLLDERKAYRRISDYFHRERAAKKAKDSNINGISNSFNRSTTRSITQVPEQISSSIPMDDDEEIDHDNDQQQPLSPTITNESDELIDINPSHNFDDERHQQIHSSNKQKRLPSSSSAVNGKSDLLSVRSHLEKALHELNRALSSKDDLNDDEQYRSDQIRNNHLTNGHRHSKLDDIVRSLSNVVNQQQENARLILDESSSLLLVDDEHQQNLRISTQESIKTVVQRLNMLVDRGNSIYDRIESILAEF